MRARASSLATFLLGVSFIALATCGVSWAQTAEPPGAQAMIEALTRARAAVVGLDVTAAEGARSAETLGRRRLGSGVVIGPDGLILTIGYLVLEADTIRIVTQDDRTFPARTVAYDLATGFGLVKPLLPVGGISPVPLGSYASAEPGQPMVAASGDGDLAMTRLVSKRAFSGYWEYHIEAALFTSPPVANHSGAALFNQRGELLGVGSLFVADALGEPPRVPGNMFVPVDLLKPILGEMQQTGTSRPSRRPWLGLSSTEQSGRVQVVRVAAGSPAQAGGIEAGDIILAVDGVGVATLEEFYKRVWAHPSPEADIVLTVLQGAQVKTMRVHAVDRMSTMARPAGI